MASSIASRPRRWLAGGAVAGLIFAIGGGATAQPTPERLVAQALFDRARTLMDAGRFADACPLLAESQRLDPGGGTLLNFAVCLEQAGRLASAQAAFQDALGQAIKDARADRKQVALERLAHLAAHVSTLSVDVPPSAQVPGLVVTLDGVALGRVAWGVPTAVDGGEHRVEATAPGHAPWSAAVHIAREGQVARLEVPAPRRLAPPPPPSCAPDTRLVDGRCVSAPTPPPPSAPRALRLSRASWIVGGVGVGLGAAAVATGVAALVLDDQAEADALARGCNLARGFCPSGRTTAVAGALSKAATAQGLGWAATSAAVGGGISLLTAIFLPRVEVPVTVKAGAARRSAWVGLDAAF